MTVEQVRSERHEYSVTSKSIVVAMSNKWDKIELIVQKLTEC